MPNKIRLMALIGKCPDFLAEMSGILVDTRITTYCKSVAGLVVMVKGAVFVFS